MHLRIGRNRQLHRTATRTNRHQHVSGGGRRQQPNRMRRRLLNRLQQHIGGTLRHALGVLHQNHAPATYGRAVLSLHDQLARLINADVRRLGTKVRKICVRTVHHGHAALALAASAVLRVGLLAQQRGRKDLRSLTVRRTGCTRKKPSVRGAVGGGIRAQLLELIGGNQQGIPEAHESSLPVRTSSRAASRGSITSSTRACTCSIVPTPSITRCEPLASSRAICSNAP